MLAAYRKSYVPFEYLKLAECPRPQAGPGEILVRVMATTVNRTDCAIVPGKPAIMRLFTGLVKPKNPVPGTDFAGIVEAVGEQVSAFSVGDRVWGFNDNGCASQAQFMVADKSVALSKLPDQIEFATAAAAIEGTHYAYNFLTKVELQSEQKAIVNGADGAIGSALLQFLHYFGLQVTAVCHSSHRGAVEAMQPQRLISYDVDDFTELQERYDFVFDAVGKSTFGRCRRLLTDRGIYISSELGPGMQNPLLALRGLFWGKQKVIFPVPVDIPRSLAFIEQRLLDGSFKPLIERTYRPQQIAEAYQYAASGKKSGNLLINWEL